MTSVQRPVPEDLAGERADRIVAVLGELSRSEARSLVEAGEATFDGAPVRPADRITAGAMLDVALPAPPPPLAPEAIEFEVRYEDEHVAVVDKPRGVTVHPGAGRRSGTLAAGILDRWPRVRGVGADDRWGIVHRLDRETSGLLVVGLTHDAHAGLQDLIRRRAVERTYLAVVHGTPDAATGTVDAPIARDPRHPTRFRVHRDGRPSRTHYAVERDLGDRCLLRVTLETGRTHQIRVHMASVGHPVVGDRVYGRADGASRLWLHAHRLRFTHPITGEAVDVVSPLPDELRATLEP
jgi:23S rRNA pseudouridine1911/1915/1917 synthase